MQVLIWLHTLGMAMAHLKLNTAYRVHETMRCWGLVSLRRSTNRIALCYIASHVHICVQRRWWLSKLLREVRDNGRLEAPPTEIAD